jgi:hypothetical protein
MAHCRGPGSGGPQGKPLARPREGWYKATVMKRSHPGIGLATGSPPAAAPSGQVSPQSASSLDRPFGRSIIFISHHI